MLRRCAFAIGFGALVYATCFAQKPSWQIEHHDGLLVAPGAKNVTYKAGTVMRHNGPAEQDELIYTVEEPYPASDLIGQLKDDLKSKGWRQSGIENWIEIPSTPGKTRNRYLWGLSWDKANEGVSYELEYPNSSDDHYQRTLHIHAYFGVVAPPPTTSAPPVYSTRTTLKDRLLAYSVMLAYLLALLGIPLLLARSNVRSAVFYDGPNAWVTWINLGLFAPLAVSFLLAWTSFTLPIVFLILALFLRVGYAACAVVVLSMAGILLAKGLPRRVRIAHLVLGLLSLGFFMVCIVLRSIFSHPFLQL